MDLKEFVAESLKEIIKGIAEAQPYALEHGAEICPNVTPTGEPKSDYISAQTQQPVIFVKFDVAVSAEESIKKKGSGKLNIKIASVGAGKESEEKESSISRLRFGLPVVWPLQGEHKK